MDESVGTMPEPVIKPRRVKNRWYREFLDMGRITTVTHDEINKALSNVKGKYTRMGRALLILLYYTGCRPVEALQLRSADVRQEERCLVVFLRTAKRGVAREIFLPLNNDHIKELKQYLFGMPPSSYVFYGYVSRAKHRKKHKKDGSVYYISQTTHKLQHHFKMWFRGVRDGGITPYFLRHNCFSRLAEMGHDQLDIKYLKGAKQLKSVEPYLHVSSVKAKKLSLSLNKI